jgi:hypothetical protein
VTLAQRTLTAPRAQPFDDDSLMSQARVKGASPWPKARSSRTCSSCGSACCVPVIAVVICFVPLAFFQNELFTLVAQPLIDQLPEGTSLIATSVVSPFMAPLKLSLICARVHRDAVRAAADLGLRRARPVQARAPLRACR